MSGLTDDEFVKNFREAGLIIAKASHIVQKEKKTGWFSSESQQEKGRLSAQSPSSILFSAKKAHDLGRQSRKNKMFSIDTPLINYVDHFLLSRDYQEIFCIKYCCSSKDILERVARIDYVVQRKSKDKNFRFTKIIEDAQKSIFKCRCRKISANVVCEPPVSLK